MTPLKFVKRASDSTAKTYKTVQDCYEDSINAKLGYNSESDKWGSAKPRSWFPTFADKARKFASSNGMKVLAELEEKYDCASVCSVPLFYISRDVAEGRPTQECAAGLYHAMKGSYKAEAAFSLICSFVLVASCIAAVIMYFGPKLDEDDEEKPDANAEDRANKYKDNGTELQTQNPAAINDENKA
jgi:hypothetical protein